VLQQDWTSVAKMRAFILAAAISSRAASLDAVRHRIAAPGIAAPTLPTRRALLGAAAAAAASSALPAKAAGTLVTLELNVARAPSAPLRIEILPENAPKSAEYFLALCRGTLRARCADYDEPGLARAAASARAQERICLDQQGIDVNLVNSQMWRLVPDKRVDFGRIDSSFAAREPPSFPAEANGELRPSQRGAVSVKRGGGAFEFTITPKTNPGLDKEELVVIGRVLDEDLPVLDALNAIPAKKDLVSLGDVPPLGSKIARACEYANPDATCAQFKPLKRVVVSGVAVAS
jgi:cyclophilin family peptidyl-prolyl cis-trans isomerase